MNGVIYVEAVSKFNNCDALLIPTPGRDH